MTHKAGSMAWRRRIRKFRSIALRAAERLRQQTIYRAGLPAPRR